MTVRGGGEEFKHFRKPLVLGDDMGAAVLLPAILGLIRADGLILAVADHRQLRRRNSHGLEKFGHRLGALVTQRDIIFFRATLVTMPFDTKFLARVIRQDTA